MDFNKVLDKINPDEKQITLLGRENPCNNIFKAQEFLQQTERLEDMREDFLERELEKMCLQSGQENQYAEQLYRKKVNENLETEFKTKIVEPHNIKEKVKFDVEEEIIKSNAPAIIKSKTIRKQPKSPFIYMEESLNKQMKVKSTGFCEGNKDHQLQKLNDITTTLQCSNPNLILPHDSNGNAKMLNVTDTGDNQYLHIVLPAKELNILNSRGEINTSQSDQNTFVEIGCKIFEINHL